MCWAWSSPDSAQLLLPPCPSPLCTGLPQPQTVLSFAWLSWFWGQKYRDGDSTRKQLQSVLLRVRREHQNYIFQKERERIQKLKKNYTNCLEESKIDMRPSPSLDRRERHREGAASLGLKEKPSITLSGVPLKGGGPSTAQARVHWQIPL